METPELAAEPKLPKGLAIAALVLAIPGLVIPLLGIVAVILGAVALVRASADLAGGKGVAIAGIVVGGVGTFTSFVGMLALVGIYGMAPHRHGGYDTAGAANARAYACAQTMYVMTDWDGDGKKEYAHPFTNLYVDASAGNKNLQLMDQGFYAAAGPAGVPKQGYLFRDCKTIGGKPIDWTTDYALCAVPAVYGRTGFSTFIISSDGRAYGKDLGAGATFVDDYPADPAKAGWVEAD